MVIVSFVICLASIFWTTVLPPFLPRFSRGASGRANVARGCQGLLWEVITSASLGLRVSELVALQWGDVDFQGFTIKIVRSFVRGEINATKTEASEGTLPLDDQLAQMLLGPVNTKLDFVVCFGSWKSPRRSIFVSSRAFHANEAMSVFPTCKCSTRCCM